MHDTRFTSITCSYGEGLLLEASSLAVLAWIKGDTKFRPNVEQSMQWVASKCKDGRFGSTQSTILALKVRTELVCGGVRLRCQVLTQGLPQTPRPLSSTTCSRPRPRPASWAWWSMARWRPRSAPSTLSEVHLCHTHDTRARTQHTQRVSRTMIVPKLRVWSRSRNRLINVLSLYRGQEQDHAAFVCAQPQGWSGQRTRALSGGRRRDALLHRHHLFHST